MKPPKTALQQMPISAAAPPRTALPFPLFTVFLACLIPVLLGVFCTVFLAPPIIGTDTAHGLIAWCNYIQGGTWNTTPNIDPSNIAQTVETPVTWWPPGQYVLLGILHLAGISLGSGSILISSISILSLGIGLAKLAEALGTPRRALPWVALTTTLSHYTLSSFSSFIGGEPILIALWPWTCLIAWNFRRCYFRLSILLPVVFLIGSYAKHSFAICALTILIFLAAEALHEEITSPTGKGDRFRHFFYTNIALLFSGLIYILGRSIITPSGNGTPAALGQVHREAAFSWGFAFQAPILGLTGIEKIIGFILFRLFKTPPEVLYPQFGVILFLFSLIPLAFYVWLITQRNNLARLTGISAISLCTMMAFLLWQGSAISLETRFYQPTIVFLTAFIAVKSFDKNRVWAVASRIILTTTMLFGITVILYRHIHMRSGDSPYTLASEDLNIVNIPAGVLSTLHKVALNPDALIFVKDPRLRLDLTVTAPKTTRFFTVDYLDEWHLSQPRQGRVPYLVLPIPEDLSQSGLGETLRRSFVDYRDEEWTLTIVDGWQIWQSMDTPVPPHRGK